MKIHEYQAKEILRKFGVAVPRGFLATTPLQADQNKVKFTDHDLFIPIH